MKKFLAVSLVVLLVSVAFAQVEKPVPVEDIIKKVDELRGMKVEFTQYNKDMKGKITEGSGKVVKIMPPMPFGKMNRVAILSPGSNPSEGYNVILFTAQNPMMELNIGQTIKFRGSFDRASSKWAVVDVTGAYEAEKK